MQPSGADCHEIWEPQPPGTLWVCPDLQWEFLTYVNKLTQMEIFKYDMTTYCSVQPYVLQRDAGRVTVCDSKSFTFYTGIRALSFFFFTRVKLAKTGHGPHSSNCCVVLCIVCFDIVLCIVCV